jgi:hypothetical protein
VTHEWGLELRITKSGYSSINVYILTRLCGTFFGSRPRLQILIAGIMLRQGLVRDFPIFFTYNVQILSKGRFLSLITTRPSPTTCTEYTYWVSNRQQRTAI